MAGLNEWPGRQPKTGEKCLEERIIVNTPEIAISQSAVFSVAFAAQRWSKLRACSFSPNYE
jgi:hypothetical protein